MENIMESMELLGSGTTARGDFFDAPSGSPMRRLAAGLLKYGGIGGFRALAPLPKNTQELFDATVVGVGTQRLAIVADLLAAGMTYNLPNWLSVMSLYAERVSRSGFAQRTMIPKARGERQVGTRSGWNVPIFCTWDDFSFGIREMLAAERVGAPLDTSHLEQATLNVNEAIEDQSINGAAIAINGQTAPGFLTAPANNFVYAGNEAWDNAGHTGEEILSDILSGIQLLQNKGFYGPYNLYVPTSYGLKLVNDYKSATSGTTLERVQQINAGGRGLVVRTADFLPANKTLLIQMTKNVADVIVGQEPAQITWEDAAGFEQFFMVMACMIVRVKQDITGAQGWAVGYTS